MACNESFPWLVQLIGHSMDFSAIRLFSPGLYVNIPRFSTSLPATVSELETDVLTLLCTFLTFRSHHVIDATEKSKCSLHQKMNSVSALGRMNYNNSTSEMQYWTYPTYYTPPSNYQSKLPSNLHGIAPPSKVINKAIEASLLTDNDNTSGLNVNDICEFCFSTFIVNSIATSTNAVNHY